MAEEYHSFLEFMRSRWGSRWCVAARTSRKTEGYDTVISPRQFDRERDTWARSHPAWVMADALPDDDAGRFIRKAVLTRLNA